jgi:hypothetical protein
MIGVTNLLDSTRGMATELGYIIFALRTDMQFRKTVSPPGSLVSFYDFPLLHQSNSNVQKQNHKRF